MVDSGDVMIFPTPTFDYGSSLGRELCDERRMGYLCSGTVRDYLLSREGSLFVSRGRKKSSFSFVLGSFAMSLAAALYRSDSLSH